ncbi:uncharacterized protein [Pocillopora verrucosa]|uniref:uncharacterized protein n=1 Tax=Pocillopora verrucosa TaxID=203993 RepID=UPI00333FF2D5
MAFSHGVYTSPTGLLLLDDGYLGDFNNDVSSLYVEIIHKNRSYYKCTICGRRLSRKQRLETHLSCVHGKGHNYQLFLCSMAFPFVKVGWLVGQNKQKKIKEYPPES